MGRGRWDLIPMNVRCCASSSARFPHASPAPNPAAAQAPDAFPAFRPVDKRQLSACRAWGCASRDRYRLVIRKGAPSSLSSPRNPADSLFAHAFHLPVSFSGVQNGHMPRTEAAYAPGRLVGDFFSFSAIDRSYSPHAESSLLSSWRPAPRSSMAVSHRSVHPR